MLFIKIPLAILTLFLAFMAGNMLAHMNHAIIVTMLGAIILQIVIITLDRIFK